MYEQRCETCMWYEPTSETVGCCTIEVPADVPYRVLTGRGFVCEEWVPKWGVEA